MIALLEGFGIKGHGKLGIYAWKMGLLSLSRQESLLKIPFPWFIIVGDIWRHQEVTQPQELK